MDLPMDGAPRGAINVLACVAIGEDGEVVGCVLLPPQINAMGDTHAIDWDARLATAQELFKTQNPSE